MIKIREETPKPIDLGDRDTPRGSVLSPMLFSQALLTPPAILDTIEGIDHAVYADDIIIWTYRVGSEG